VCVSKALHVYDESVHIAIMDSETCTDPKVSAIFKVAILYRKNNVDESK
jgi:hypothetical protein